LNRFNLLPPAVLAAVLSLVIGCSDSSGPSALTVSAQNAEAIAAEGMGAVDMLEGMSELVEGFTDVLENPSAQTVVPCDSGEMSLYVSDVNEPGVFSSGDYATLSFNQCIMNIGEQAMTLSGSLTITAVTVEGAEPGPFTVEVSAEFDRLVVAFFGATMIIDGGFTLELSSADGETLSAIVSGEYFSFTAQIANQAYSGWLKDFRQERTLNTTTGAYLLDHDATVYNSQLGGTVTFDTSVSFAGVAPGDPETGSITATGAEGATVTLNATGAGTVEILIDADADGVDETTINTTWDVLNNS